MSVHTFNANIEGQCLHVKMGWDSLMQSFYLVVSPVADDGDIEDPVYSNLDEAHPESKDLDYYLGICARLGIAVPEEMVAAVREDRVTGAMNRVVNYG
jgi:hypothetical protein